MADNSFKDFVLDQLSGLAGVRSRAMFGGHGLYQRDRFFAILLGGRLYFKTDAQSRADFEQRGMQPFIYEKARQTVSIHYFEVPPDVLEDRHELVRWAQRAVAAAGKEPKPRFRRAGKRPSRELNLLTLWLNSSTYVCYSFGHESITHICGCSVSVRLGRSRGR